MNVVRRSQLSGKVNSMELDITANQIAQYESGKFLIQDIFPNLIQLMRLILGKKRLLHLKEI